MRTLKVKFWQCVSIAMLVGASLHSADGGPNVADPKLVDPKSVLPNASGQIAGPTVTGSRPAGQKVIVRGAAESIQKLARRILPHGAQTVTRPVEMEFPPLGKVILVLYEPGSEDKSDKTYSIYWGWLLVPNGNSASYRIETLPLLKDGFGTLDYSIKSVFTADADGDGLPELCVLSAISEIGSGDKGKDDYDTDIFKWSGGAFILVEQGDDRPLSGLRNAKAVRARLKKMLVNQSSSATKGLR
jgi:hypothetical protein